MQIVADGFSYLECPRWHRGKLWVSDFYTHRVLAVDDQGQVEEIAHVPNQPSGLGFMPDGSALIVSMRDRKILRRDAAGIVTEHADLSHLAPWHLNDMVVDQHGRAYVGNFGFDLMSGAETRATCLIRVDPDGSAKVVADELLFPNGAGITADGKSLIISESFGGVLSCFDIHANGDLSHRRVWAKLGDKAGDVHNIAETAGVPDGMCIDAEGAVWVADAIHHCVIRIAEGGKELDRISTGELGVYACMLGGSDGRTLYLCTAPSFSEEERKHTRDAVLKSVRVKVAHAGLP